MKRYLPRAFREDEDQCSYETVSRSFWECKEAVSRPALTKKYSRNHLKPKWDTPLRCGCQSDKSAV